MHKPLKTYQLKIDSQVKIDAIEHLNRQFIAKNKNLADALSEYALEQYNKSRLKSQRILVTESQLLSHARQEGLTTAKVSVVQYRRKGVLQDEDGPWYFQNAQHKVVYDLEKMMAFLRKRAEKPKSRISAPATKRSRKKSSSQH